MNIKIRKSTKQEKTEYQKDYNITLGSRNHFVTTDQLKHLIEEGNKLIEANHDEDVLQRFCTSVWGGITPKDEQALIDKFLKK